jgi:hypothetical protein
MAFSQPPLRRGLAIPFPESPPSIFIPQSICEVGWQEEILVLKLIVESRPTGVIFMELFHQFNV